MKHYNLTRFRELCHPMMGYIGYLYGITWDPITYDLNMPVIFLRFDGFSKSGDGYPPHHLLTEAAWGTPPSTAAGGCFVFFFNDWRIRTWVFCMFLEWSRKVLNRYIYIYYVGKSHMSCKWEDRFGIMRQLNEEYCHCFPSMTLH